MRGSIGFTSEESSIPAFKIVVSKETQKKNVLSNKRVNLTVGICSLECLIGQGDACYNQRTTSGDLMNCDLKQPHGQVFMRPLAKCLLITQVSS